MDKLIELFHHVHSPYIYIYSAPVKLIYFLSILFQEKRLITISEYSVHTLLFIKSLL